MASGQLGISNFLAGSPPGAAELREHRPLSDVAHHTTPEGSTASAMIRTGTFGLESGVFEVAQRDTETRMARRATTDV